MTNPLRWIYLSLALMGAIFPWQANLEFMQAAGGSGFDLQQFIADANINPAARSLSRDLLIGASAVSLWIVVEAKRLQIKHWWVALIACFSISFACGAPLFLFLREGRLSQLEQDGHNPP
ncbi:MAG: DUF2834 domain-containing protein [Synechococcus sp.]|nr:DUF2834 domain-containing protein [Synechococcus sp.]